MNRYLDNCGKHWDRMAPDKGCITREYYHLGMSAEEHGNYIYYVRDYAHKNINLTPLKRISGSESKNTPEYTLCHNGQIFNDQLRNGDAAEEIFTYSNYIKRYELKDGFVVYRAVWEDVFKQMEKNALEHEGVDLYEKGFLYTSLTKATIPERDYNLRIFLPKGTCAFYSGNVNGELGYYQEVVVQRGGKLKILSKDKKFINCLLLSTEL